MSRREVELAKVGHLIPRLLASIQDASGLPPKELCERLGEVMEFPPASLRRNWLRWSAVSSTVDYKGRQARSDSLGRLVSAARQLGWLVNAQRDGCGPLLEVLSLRLEQSEVERQRAARRSLDYLRRQVRVAIDDRGSLAFDNPTWFIAVCQIVSTEVERGLRRRLLAGWAPPSPIPVELKDDLLSGAVSGVVGKILEQGFLELHEFAAQVQDLECAELAAFDAMREVGLPREPEGSEASPNGPLVRNGDL